MLTGSILFGLFLAIRAETLLTLFNFSAAIALLVGAALVSRGRDIWDSGRRHPVSPMGNQPVIDD